MVDLTLLFMTRYEEAHPEAVEAHNRVMEAHPGALEDDHGDMETTVERRGSECRKIRLTLMRIIIWIKNRIWILTAKSWISVPDPDQSDRGKLTSFKSGKSDPDPDPHRSKKPDHTAKILYENTKQTYIPKKGTARPQSQFPTVMFLCAIHTFPTMGLHILLQENRWTVGI